MQGLLSSAQVSWATSKTQTTGLSTNTFTASLQKLEFNLSLTNVERAKQQLCDREVGTWSLNQVL